MGAFARGFGLVAGGAIAVGTIVAGLVTCGVVGVNQAIESDPKTARDAGKAVGGWAVDKGDKAARVGGSFGAGVLEGGAEKIKEKYPQIGQAVDAAENAASEAAAAASRIAEETKRSRFPSFGSGSSGKANGNVKMCFEGKRIPDGAHIPSAATPCPPDPT